jgi:hypothetical protein
VNHDKIIIIAQMRMGVLGGWLPVCRPTRVTDAYVPFHGLGANKRYQVIQLTSVSPDFNMTVRDDR